MSITANTDPQEIIQTLQQYKSRIQQMDRKVRDYVSNREKFRHPFPEGLIEEIRRYEKQIYRINVKEVQLRLDSLMNTLLAYERSWNQLFQRQTEKQ